MTYILISKSSKSGFLIEVFSLGALIIIPSETPKIVPYNNDKQLIINYNKL